jgi:hypothetical protein
MRCVEVGARRAGTKVAPDVSPLRSPTHRERQHVEPCRAASGERGRGPERVTISGGISPPTDLWRPCRRQPGSERVAQGAKVDRRLHLDLEHEAARVGHGAHHA